MTLPHVNDVAPSDQTRWYRIFWGLVGVGFLVGLGLLLHFVVTLPIVEACK